VGNSSLQKEEDLMGFVKPGKLMAFLVCLALAAAFGVTGTIAQEATKISGTLTLAYTAKDSLVVGDEGGHLMMLDLSEGKNVSTGDNAFMDGAQAANMSFADMTLGNGVNQGYVKFAAGDDAVYAKWSGTLTMVLTAEDEPDVSFEGEYTYIMGTGQYENIKGGGTYKGKFTSDTEYVCDWEGEYSIGE
jgi:hypothetical protein